jgi:hypothetical protein
MPKARVEGAAKKVSVPAASEDFASFVKLFKTEHAEEYEAIRLCPLEAGLEVMIERLK